MIGTLPARPVVFRCVALAALLLSPLPVEGQEPVEEQEPVEVQEEEDPTEWEFEAELGAAMFFGNRSQTTITTRAGTEASDDAKRFELEGRFTYGEATDDEGQDFVNKRSWKVESTFDLRALERWSPSFSVETESSFEKRIALRTSFGMGAKYSMIRSDRTRIDFNATLLGEKTSPRLRPDEVPEPRPLKARWSIKANARRSWGEDDRLTFTSDTSWRPKYDRINDFTFQATSSLSYRLSEVISVKLTFIDSYDSLAVDRGADTNNDGQLVLTLLSSF